MTTTEISIIVPLYNEEENVELLYRSIKTEIAALNVSYEIVFVDDGSSDDTFNIVNNLATQDHRLKIIKFRKNYGQTPAMAAGIDFATGQILITMDGDLQNDPSDIKYFIDQINKGYDLVVGWRHNRQDKLVSRKIPSKIANWLIGRVTGVPIKDNGCSLKAYKADVIKSVPLYSEMHRFIPAMSSISGARIAEIKVKHHPRKYGVSKYGLSRIYKVLLDLVAIKTIIAFAAQPLLWFAKIAIPFAIIGVVALFRSLYDFFVISPTLNLPITATGFLFLTLSIILFLSGMVGELIYKTGDYDPKKLALTTSATIEK